LYRGDKMISNENIRIFSTIPKTLKEILEKDSKDNFRTISEQVHKLIADFYAGNLIYKDNIEEKK
ncbi:MAG: hypothetical protein KBT03_05825, partial [Bacteroidales bacterium]|nr:hypothetical protein [Candidatus Scybalousia scybalohippi]